MYKNINNGGVYNRRVSDRAEDLTKNNKYIVTDDDYVYPTHQLTPKEKSGIDKDDVFKIIALLITIIGPVLTVYITLHDDVMRHNYALKETESNMDRIEDNLNEMRHRITNINDRIRTVESNIQNNQNNQNK